MDPQIKSQLKKMYDEIRQTGGTVEVTAPYELSDSEKKNVESTFTFIKNADVEYHVDPSLIAGLIITHGSKMIDLSLKSELQNLKHRMYESI